MNNSYETTHKTMIKSTKALIKLLEKTENWRIKNNKTDSEILNLKLAPDMMPFSRQVQVVSDNLKSYCFRLGGLENVVMYDNEETLLQLVSRVKRTLQFAENVDFSKADINEINLKKIKLPWLPGDVSIPASNYVTEFAIPNFYFHLSMVYSNLRAFGMDIGKMDFLDGLTLIQDN